MQYQFQFPHHQGQEYHLTEAARQVCYLPVEQITLRAGENLTEMAAVAALAASISEIGLQKAITVEKTGEDKYRVVSGNQRLMACRLLGHSHIDAVVLWPDTGEEHFQPLIRGLLSGKLHYLEMARALQRLNRAFGLRREELARTLGVSHSAVTAKIALAELDLPLQALLMEENLPESIARSLTRLPDRDARMRIARKAAEQGLKVREVEAMVSSALHRLPASPVCGGRTVMRVHDYRLYLNAIRAVVRQMEEAGMSVSRQEKTGAAQVEMTITMSTRNRRAAR